MGDNGHHGYGHYIRIWAILLVLLVISVLGPMLEIQIVTLVTAFGIAGVKAYLVCKHFMHLDVEKPMVWYILATCLVFMVLFFAGVSPDVMKHDGTNWSNEAAKAAVARGIQEPAHHGDDHGGHDEAGHHGDGGHDKKKDAHGAGGHH